jgi:hypothetical protein
VRSTTFVIAEACCLDIALGRPSERSPFRNRAVKLQSLGMEHPPTASDLFGRKRTKSKFQRAGEAQLWLSLGLHTGLVAGYDAEQPVRLAVDPVGEVEDIRTAVVAAHPELDRPQAARG